MVITTTTTMTITTTTHTRTLNTIAIVDSPTTTQDHHPEIRDGITTNETETTITHEMTTDHRINMTPLGVTRRHIVNAVENEHHLIVATLIPL